MAVKQLSDANTDGTVLGQSTSDKISFYGVSTIAQQTLTTASVLTTTSTLTTIGTALTEIQVLLENLGLINRP